MKILTVIVSYNAVSWIERCLQSVLASTVASDIMVVDNASQDDTCKIINKHFPKVILKKNETNLGFGCANNIGLKYALENAYDYVLLLNQDARVSSDMLQELIDIAENRPDFAVLSPIHLNGKGDKMDARFFNYLVSGCAQYITDMIVKNAFFPVYPCGFVNAAVWLMSKRCITKVGGFDPLYFHMGEDVDYCVRVIKKGLKIGICPETYAYHDRENRKPSQYDNYFTHKQNNTIVNLKNEPLFSLVKTFFKLCKDGLHHLLHGRMKQFVSDFKIAFLILLNNRKILRSRYEAINDRPYL